MTCNNRLYYSSKHHFTLVLYWPGAECYSRGIKGSCPWSLGAGVGGKRLSTPTLHIGACSTDGPTLLLVSVLLPAGSLPVLQWLRSRWSPAIDLAPNSSPGLSLSLMVTVPAGYSHMRFEQDGWRFYEWMTFPFDEAFNKVHTFVLLCLAFIL